MNSAADQISDVPHPSECLKLIGQSRAEAQFLAALNSGRLHHAWLITGQKGIGKATLAWRIARFLRVYSSPGIFDETAKPSLDSLDIPEDHPIMKLSKASIEPGIRSLSKQMDSKTGRVASEISVEEVRELKRFFSLTSPDDTYRIAIVDAADDLNRSSSNALLKLLEEPPERSLILLVSHSPSLLLSTITSRCRVLKCYPIASDELVAVLEDVLGADGMDYQGLAELAMGSVGKAIRIRKLGGTEIYKKLLALLNANSRLDHGMVEELVAGCERSQDFVKFEMVNYLISVLIARLAMFGATGSVPTEACPGETIQLKRVSPGRRSASEWAQLHGEISVLSYQAKESNIDAFSVLFEQIYRLQSTVATVDTWG